jgi:hypothetical protein
VLSGERFQLSDFLAELPEQLGEAFHREPSRSRTGFPSGGTSSERTRRPRRSFPRGITSLSEQEKDFGSESQLFGFRQATDDLEPRVGAWGLQGNDQSTQHSTDESLLQSGNLRRRSRKTW